MALAEAAKVGNVEISQYLISNGADSNYRDVTRVCSPLYFAAASNDLALVRLFLASGAQPNLHDGSYIPVFAAARAQSMDVVRALVAAGADVHVRNHALQSVLFQFTNIDILRFLLESGVDPNLEDRAEKTALFYACRHRDEQVAYTAVELLLQFGAVARDTSTHKERTAVDLAMALDRPEIVRILEPLVQNIALKSRILNWWKSRTGETE
ncbi:ankyrin repeat-containing domain protein [Mycena filopes]|nr:ankyrin repeat-containing domain protein [Mycena filopes]